MDIKKICLLFTLVIISLKVQSQQEIARTNCCCSNYIEQIAGGWKKDFTDSSSYRLLSYKLLMTCKIDTVSTGYILSKLGKPESTGYNNKEIEYRYHFFKYGSMSGKNLDEIIGIKMTFSKGKNQLVSTELILNDY